ncbi:hypothetical protein HC028_03430 [Planosporangium flavigriseum]|uniref:Uncharacterized protein n=1 Tax=Planosporangium flavigriseum TaxID=373681 RepID=A0A8J3LSA1_9ACTN|nr:hypothetical protein [Planosporangium flavigriseum]NJC63567.1 hypothetical protein [Planosporangium flavigriseum]GIG72265.1 hypothetical protein Pfl04_06690 [Planosporangium flavigriseum]
MGNVTRKGASSQPQAIRYLTEVRRLVMALAALVTAVGSVIALFVR